MNNVIVPYIFDGSEIRIIIDDNGEPLFVAKDVATALGYADSTNAIKQHCRGVVKHHPIIDSMGRTQEARVISYSDMTRLIVSSKLESAQRFEAWVFEEVIPTIHKTGSYQLQPAAPAPLPGSVQDLVNSILLIADRIAAVPGVQQGIAMAQALTCIGESTSLSVEALRLALPAKQGPVCSLNASKLGAMLGLSARKTNALLMGRGLQGKNERGEWELTEAGNAWGEALPFSRNGHAGYQILWCPEIVDWITNDA